MRGLREGGEKRVRRRGRDRGGRKGKRRKGVHVVAVVSRSLAPSPGAPSRLLLSLRPSFDPRRHAEA